MTPIEIIALILIIVSIVKILVILVNPKSWVNVVKTVWSKPALMMVISLVLAAVVLYYLLMELTIIQVLASMAFMALLAAVGVSIYSKEVVALATKLLKDKSMVKKMWLYILIWIALLVWGISALI